MGPEILQGLRRQLDDAEADLLASVLADFGKAVHAVLGEALTGVYLKGSFALGSGDIHADVDFLVVTSAAYEAARACLSPDPMVAATHAIGSAEYVLHAAKIDPWGLELALRRARQEEDI